MHIFNLLCCFDTKVKQKHVYSRDWFKMMMMMVMMMMMMMVMMMMMMMTMLT